MASRSGEETVEVMSEKPLEYQEPSEFASE